MVYVLHLHYNFHASTFSLNSLQGLAKQKRLFCVFCTLDSAHRVKKTKKQQRLMSALKTIALCSG